jgi:hypothetical protein
VILAAGGFEANTEWRARYLGRGWDLAKVRGSRFNTGDGIRMAMEVGAMPYGNWSVVTPWDGTGTLRNFGDLAVGDGFQKHSYPFGIMVNADGRRFVDEGADFRNYTYAKYGHVILEQPGQFAWQIFDQQVTHLLRDEYRIREVTKVTSDTLEGLVGKLDGVNSEAALATIQKYNESIRTDVPFNPNVLDGRKADLAVPEVELGQPARRTALRGVSSHLRDHLHLRWPQDRRERAGHRHRGPGHAGALRMRRTRRRHFLLQLPGRFRSHLGFGVRPTGGSLCRHAR